MAESYKSPLQVNERFGDRTALPLLTHSDSELCCCKERSLRLMVQEQWCGTSAGRIPRTPGRPKPLQAKWPSVSLTSMRAAR
jgi:hypothetical protein